MITEELSCDSKKTNGGNKMTKDEEGKNETA